MTFGARLRRYFKRALLGLALLVVVVAAALTWLLVTSSGRATLLRVALGQVNALIPGTLQVRELARLEPSWIELRGIAVLDPDGKRVLELERLAVELDAGQLLSGRIVVPALGLERGAVDLRQLGDPRRGLVAAFVDPSAPPAPPSPGPPPFVRIEQVHVTRLDLQAPELPSLGQLQVRGLELDASFELDGEPAAVVRQLNARFERGGEPLGSLEHLSATLSPHGELSAASLAAELCGMRLELAAELLAPPAPSWKSSPVNAFVELRQVSGASLARLLQQPALGDALSGSVNVQAQALGSVEALWLRLAVDTQAGAISLGAQVEQLALAKVSLRTRDFALARLRPDLPDHHLDLELSASADARRPESIPLHLNLRDSRLDGALLPTVDASGTLAPGALHGLVLVLRDGASQVSLEGDAQLTGSGRGRLQADIRPETLAKWQRFAGAQLDAKASVHADLELGLDAERRVTAKGRVDARQLELGSTRAQLAHLELDVRGDPLQPTGRVSLQVTEANVGEQAISQLTLRVQGGPQRYELAVDGTFEAASADVKLRVGRFGERIELSGEGQGQLRGQPWQLKLGETSLSLAGELRTEGITLDVAGQGLGLRGHFSGKGGRAELTTGTLELEKLSQAFGLPQALKGTANLHAELTGTLATPILAVELRGRGLALGGKPPLDIDAQANLDARSGTLDGKLALRAAQPEAGVVPLALELELAHRFDGGVAWSKALPDGVLDATLALERVDSGFVGRWASLEPLPVAGILSGKLHASGTRHDPKLQAQLTTQLSVSGTALGVETQLDYQSGAGTVALAAKDARGPWLALQANLELAAGPLGLAQLLERLPGAASDARWRVELDARERNVSELPGLSGRDDIPAAVAASLRAEHLPGAEPQLSLAVAARPTRAPAGWDVNQRCSLDATRVELDAKLHDGQLKAELTARDGSKRLLGSSVAAPLRLAPALAGGTPELGAIEARLDAQQLSLQSLPLVCGLARGSVDAKLSVLDPLGKSPSLDLELNARGFSFGAPQAADLALRARLAGGKASADAEIRSGGTSSQLHAEVPITLEAGHVALAARAPISADIALRNLPIAPFLPPRAGISYASGSLDGDAEVRGTLDSPQLRGRLVLKDIAFTATDLAQPLRDVKGTIDFTQNRLVLKDFEAHDKDGVLRLDGRVDFQDRQRVALSLAIAAREFPLRQQGQVVATTNIDAKVSTTLRPQQTDVTIDLGAVDVWIESTDIRSGIALEQNPDFAIDGQRPTPPEAAPPDTEHAANGAQATPAQTNLTLNARDRVWIKRDDFAVKLRTSLRTRIRGDDARVEGRVSILRGYLDLMGKTFDIDQSSYLDFIGSPSPDPVLSIAAKHQNRRSGSTISVAITGRGSAPVLTFRVDDRIVSVGDAFQAIYGSQQSNQDPNGASSQARAFVGGLTAGLLATTARRELGAAAPIIMIEPGEASGEGRIRAGFEFDSLVPKFMRSFVTGVYFEGILANESSGGSSSQKSDARVQAGFLLELYFPNNFFSAGQQGPGTTWSVDVGWQL